MEPWGGLCFHQMPLWFFAGDFYSMISRVCQLSSWAYNLRPLARFLAHAFGTSFKRVFNTQPCRLLQSFLGNTYFTALSKMKKKENAA